MSASCYPSGCAQFEEMTMFQLHRGITALILAASVFGLAGCVTDEEHQQALNDKSALETKLNTANGEKKVLEGKVSALQSLNSSLQAKAEENAQKIGTLTAQKQAEKQAKLAARGQAHVAQQREDAASKTAAAAVNQAAKIKATASTGKKTG